MDDILAVDVSESTCDLRSVEFGLLVRKLARSAEMGEEFATSNALHDDIDKSVILGIAHHVHHKRVINLSHQAFLVVDVVDLLELDNLMLFHELHGIEFSVLF